MKQWGWLIQYGVSVLVAVLLATILGSFPLFKEAAVAGSRLKAAHLVQFIGYGAALVLVVLMAQRAALQMCETSKVQMILRHLLLPLCTLVAVSIGYKVTLLLLGAFLDKTWRAAYDWIFVVAIAGAALWIAVAWFQHSESLLEDRPAPRPLKRQASSE